MEKYRLLAAVIYAHDGHVVKGRVRLQKTVHLLQLMGFPTDYSFRLHFHGPYSEDVQADVALLDCAGMVVESHVDQGYVYEARVSDSAADLGVFKTAIDRIQHEDAACLELAATYEAYRGNGDDHEHALESMRRKKSKKWSQGCENDAMTLLVDLGLLSN